MAFQVSNTQEDADRQAALKQREADWRAANQGKFANQEEQDQGWQQELAGANDPKQDTTGDLQDRGMNTFRASNMPLDQSRFGYGSHMSDQANLRISNLQNDMNQVGQRGLLNGAEAQTAYARNERLAGMGESQLQGMARIANGQQQTTAEMVGRKQQDAAMAQQMAMANSARGGGPGAALAQYQAQSQASRGAADIGAQTAASASQERMQASNAVLAGSQGMRGQDMGTMNMALQARGMNDQAYAGLMNARESIYTQQNQANIEHERLRMQGHIAADQTNATINQKNADAELDGGGEAGFYGQAIGTIASLF